VPVGGVERDESDESDKVAVLKCVQIVMQVVLYSQFSIRKDGALHVRLENSKSKRNCSIGWDLKTKFLQRCNAAVELSTTQLLNSRHW